ncbi:MAG: EAL domain-containing protein [Dokdonella sp.]
MAGILIVERSTTLSHVLKRTLDAAHLTPRGELTSFADALTHFRSQSAGNDSYSVVVIGAPARATREFLDLLEFLRSDPAAPITLLMTHEATSEAQAWTNSLRNGHLLLWSQFARLPTLVLRLSPEEGRGPAAPSEGDGLRLLFVDDSRTVRLGYKRLLQRSGFVVDTAESLAQAIDAEEKNPYDLIIVDYLLSDGSGDELCRRIAAVDSRAVIAVLTGSYREDIVKRCLDAGASECMFKNEAVDLFVARVRLLARQVILQRAIDTDRQRLDGMLGAIGEGVFGIDAASRISFANPAALRMLGYDDDAELIDADAFARLQPHTLDGSELALEDSPFRQRERAHDEPTPAMGTAEIQRDVEVAFRRKDGGVLQVDVTLVPLLNGGRDAGAIFVFRDLSEYQRAEKLHHELSHDQATGLFNHRHLGELLAFDVMRRREQGGYSALLVIDIERNPRGDDGQVHPDLLTTLAGILKQQRQTGERLARLDDHRLAILYSDVELENLPHLAERARLLLVEARDRSADGARRNAVIAVCVIGSETASAEAVFERARRACQRARRRGARAIEIDTGAIDSRSAHEMATLWSDRFRAAIAQERLVLLARPVAPMGSLPTFDGGALVGQEWRVARDATNGRDAASGREFIFDVSTRMVGRNGQLVTPGVFAPLAARIGMMARIDRWVIERLLKHIAMISERIDHVAFVVELSRSTLVDVDALRAIEDLIAAAGGSPRHLILVIADSTSPIDAAIDGRSIARLRALGCRFALGNFGTAGNSFTELRHMAMDMVRIDGRFVQAMSTSDSDRRMVGALAQFARNLGLMTIAENADSSAIVQALRDAGIEYAQGDWIGVPSLLRRIDFARLFPAQ